LYGFLVAAGAILTAVALRLCFPDEGSGTPHKDTRPARHATQPIRDLWAEYESGGAKLSAAERLCCDFLRLKNARDPNAEALLPLPPPWPTAPITEDEADRLDAQLFIRQPFQVTQLYQQPGTDNSAPRFVLAVEGTVRAPDGLMIRTPDGGIRQHNHAVFNPDFVVEVRDGQLHCVKVKVHEDPDADSLTPAEFRLMLQQQGGIR
jgi:hypothetical protein